MLWLLVAVVQAEYHKFPHVCLPWAPNLTQVGNCGQGAPSPCDIAWLQEQCDSQAGCDAFDSNGLLFACPQSHCGCDSGTDFCLRGQDIANDSRCLGSDLFVRGAAPPWFLVDGVKNGSVLYSNPDPNICYMPEVGNGFLGSVMGWDAVYIAGLYNGACGTTHRARMPSSLLVSVQGAVSEGSALDVLHAVFLRWWRVGDSLIEQKTYAHRTRRNLLVVEFSLREGPDVHNITLLSPYSPLNQTNSSAGAGCAGDFTLDFTFEVRNVSEILSIANGKSTLLGDLQENFYVSIATSPVNGSKISLSSTASSSSGATFLTVLTSSVEGYTTQQLEQAASDMFSSALKNSSTLYAEHTNAWAKLYHAGVDIEVEQNSEFESLGRDVATHFNTSLYFLLSSVREDWSAGVCPGGPATPNYQGAVFMDQDLWVGPALTLSSPELQQSLLEYRYNSLPASRDIAKLFNYSGAMFAWTAAYQGKAFGCCNATGGFEDCLEHHVTPDIAFSVWQFYLATHNVTWLRERGYVLLREIAEFVMSRVTAKNDQFWITGVLPVDEWCVGTGCGCETPGIDNDAMMNGASIIALLAAANAAKILNEVTSRTKEYVTVAQRIPLLFNTSGGGHHDQFNSASCPSGWGGTHYTPGATVCPEDVMLLSYPFGNILGINQTVTRADAELFIPITCQENAGMTTPIHTIIWLSLDEKEKAQAEFNRSIYAACYGPFNVRNEVDKHLDISGGHFDNTHFVTGDGGYLQAVINGYGGMRITEEGLGLLLPSLPLGVTQLRFRNFRFRSLVLSISVTSTVLNLTCDKFCLKDSNGVEQKFEQGASLTLTKYAFPGLLYDC